MARRALSIVPLWATAGIVLTLTLGTLVAVALRGTSSELSPGDWAAVRFTVTQAILSALISVALAVPVARALARRRFVGRGLLISLLGAPFLLPVIVAIFGLVAVFGRSGLFNQGLAVFGFDPFSIYGFHGVVLAHVFFNLPLATRVILQGWLSIPAERFRLAASLNAQIGPLLEWPMLRQVAPGAGLVIFLICLTSFAVALTLGGGPRATTVELAIYQSVLFDFDLGRAALLACIQFALCTGAAVLAYGVAQGAGLGVGLDRVVTRWDTSKVWIDVAWIMFAALFLLVPLALVLLRGISGLSAMDVSVLEAAWRSLWIALGSTLMCITMATALALWQSRWAELIGVLPLATSSLVAGMGLFLMVFPFASPRQVALPVTLIVNATLALPFAFRIILPEVRACLADFGRLSAQLGLNGWAGLRIVILPRIQRPLGFAAGVAAALSMGDLGVIALFASDGQATLPLLMYRLMGSYQMEAAAGVGLILVLLSFGLFWAFDRGGRVNAGP